MKKISSRTKLVILISAALIVVTSIPYLYGALTAPQGRTYSGLHYLTTGDINTYFSMIEQVKQGHVSFLNLYTSEPHDRTYVNVLWLGIGFLAKVFAFSPFFAFQLARIILLPLLVYVVVRFLEYFFPQSRRKVWIGTALIFFSSGVGIFIDPYLTSPHTSIQHPVDLWVPEAIPFLTVFHSPHLIASLGLLVLTLYLGLRAFLEKNNTCAWLAGITALLLFSTHPFYVPTVYAVLGVWAFVLLFHRGKEFRFTVFQLLRIGLVSAPVLLYFLWLDRSSEVFHAWSSQNILYSPNLFMYIYGFGLLVPFAVYAGIVKRKDPKLRFIVYWAVTNLVLLYVPFSFQRRLIEGLAIPVGMLALIGIWEWIQYLRKKSWQLAAAGVLFLAVFLPLGNWQALLQDVHIYRTSEEPYIYYYYPPDEAIDGMRWIRDNTSDSDVILSSFLSGNFIPAYSGRRVFAGHSPQTIDAHEKRDMLGKFFSQDETDDARKTFLQEWNITYIYYSENEKDYGPFNPYNVEYLDEVFSSGGVSIFKVR